MMLNVSSDCTRASCFAFLTFRALDHYDDVDQSRHKIVLSSAMRETGGKAEEKWERNLIIKCEHKIDNVDYLFGTRVSIRDSSLRDGTHSRIRWNFSLCFPPLFLLFVCSKREHK